MGMSLKKNALQATLLFLALFALVAAVPGTGRTQDAKDDKGKAAKDDKDKAGKEPAANDLAPGAMRKFTGYTRPGHPGDRLGPNNQVVESKVKEEDEDAFGCTIYFT